MKNRTKALLAVAAMGVVALGAASVGTAAWFAVDATATVKEAKESYKLTAASTTISLGECSLKVTVAPAGSVELSNLKDGELYKGVYYTKSGTYAVEKITASSIGSVVKGYTLTAAWVTAPTGDTLEALKGKTLQGGTLSKEGQAFFVTSNTDVTGLTDTTVSGTGSTYTIAVSADGATLTPTITGQAFFRIQASNVIGSEESHGDNDKIVVDEVNFTY